MRQSWRKLLFLHWEVDPDALQRRLPPGLAVDRHEGRAYIGVVPFAMRCVRPVWFTAVPWLSNFLELNVRTYVHDERGVPGVWFFSLDANQPIAVEVARRWYHLNYRHARMSMKVDGERVAYRCRRRRETDWAEYEYPLAGGHAQPAEPGSLEFFLLERYLLFSRRAKQDRLFIGQVAHAPYRYELVEPGAASAVPLQWEGFDLGGEPMHAAVAHDVDVRAYAIRAHGGGH